ncbi:hypothetical protein FB451DRAFT_1362009 [Mycena latifolia]|nr:hypothetical protein FB451DRAFT_1362009 [Mycena latifolia]
MSTISAKEDPSSKVVLVMLATGRQGGALTRALAHLNESAGELTPWIILAQTRDLTSAKSKALTAFPRPVGRPCRPVLSSRSTELSTGRQGLPSWADNGAEHSDWRLCQESASSREVRMTLRHCSPLHRAPYTECFRYRRVSTTPRASTASFAQAKALADTAAKHGVKHFVYASVNFGGVPENKTYVPDFESKRLAEEYLKEKHPNLPMTILRPVTFMEQLVPEDRKSITNQVVTTMFLTQLKSKLEVVAVNDVGKVAALALKDPERYFGQTLDLAGDELSPKDFEDGWREVFGEEMRRRILGGGLLAWALRMGMTELRLMFKFFNEIGFGADIPALRAQYPDLKDWKTFLRTNVHKPTNT